MGSLLWFLIFGGLFFMMMRYGCGAHVAGHGAHAGRRDNADGSPHQHGALLSPSEAEIDPVCGMSVHTDSAKSSIYRERAYYFCSAQHREQFEADPERYAGNVSGAQPASTEHHHE